MPGIGPKIPIKRGDQRSVTMRLEQLLATGAFQVVNLTGATVKFYMRTLAGVSVISQTAVIDDATGGLVRYHFTTTDTALAGTYLAEFEVTYPGGDIETFPANGRITVEIQDDLG